VPEAVPDFCFPLLFKMRALNILLVEDNPDHAELMRRNLQDFPLANVLHHVADGESALAYIFGKNHYADRAVFPAPDLVLLDLRLPRMDGLDVLHCIRSDATHRQLPVIVLTTSDAERDVAMAYNFRASYFLTKPIDLRRLAELAEHLGLGSRRQPMTGGESTFRPQDTA
jgi:CheY-like chemotaxis protein